MIGFALLLAAAPAPPAAQPSYEPLLQAFRTFCLNGHGDRRAAAAGAGLRPVPPTSSGSGLHETSAWERDGIRLFELSARQDGLWPLPAMCGARANVGSAGDETAMTAPLLALPDYVFMETTGSRTHAHWNLILRGAGLIQVMVDRTRPADVEVTFLTSGAKA